MRTKFGISAIQLVLAVLASGCSWHAPVESAAPAPIAKATEGLGAPFSLHILQEVNDGKGLKVLASIRAKTAWPASEVLVRLIGLSNGEIAEKTEHAFDSNQPGLVRQGENLYIPADAPLQFALSIPSVSITDYQLELVWGAEARNFYRKQAPVPALKLQRLEVEKQGVNCMQPPCYTYTITGELANTGSAEIRRVTLGISLVWLRTGETLVMDQYRPEREQKIDLDNLGLLPGQSRPLKFDIDRELPETNEGYYRPVLRIISFDSATQGQ